MGCEGVVGAFVAVVAVVIVVHVNGGCLKISVIVLVAFVVGCHR